MAFVIEDDEEPLGGRGGVGADPYNFDLGDSQEDIAPLQYGSKSAQSFATAKGKSGAAVQKRSGVDVASKVSHYLNKAKTGAPVVSSKPAFSMEDSMDSMSGSFNESELSMSGPSAPSAAVTAGPASRFARTTSSMTPVVTAPVSIAPQPAVASVASSSLASAAAPATRRQNVVAVANAAAASRSAAAPAPAAASSVFGRVMSFDALLGDSAPPAASASAQRTAAASQSQQQEGEQDESIADSVTSEQSASDHGTRSAGAGGVGAGVAAPLPVGSRIEARYGGEREWYSGRITRHNGDGTVEVTYDDGDKEEAVPPSRTRLLGPPQQSRPTPTAAAAAAAVAPTAAKKPEFGRVMSFEALLAGDSAASVPSAVPAPASAHAAITASQPVAPAVPSRPSRVAELGLVVPIRVSTDAAVDAHYSKQVQHQEHDEQVVDEEGDGNEDEDDEIPDETEAPRPASSSSGSGTGSSSTGSKPVLQSPSSVTGGVRPHASRYSAASGADTDYSAEGFETEVSEVRSTTHHSTVGHPSNHNVTHMEGDYTLRFDDADTSDAGIGGSGSPVAQPRGRSTTGSSAARSSSASSGSAGVSAAHSSAAAAPASGHYPHPYPYPHPHGHGHAHAAHPSQQPPAPAYAYPPPPPYAYPAYPYPPPYGYPALPTASTSSSTAAPPPAYPYPAYPPPPAAYGGMPFPAPGYGYAWPPPAVPPTQLGTAALSSSLASFLATIRGHTPSSLAAAAEAGGSAAPLPASLQPGVSPATTYLRMLAATLAKDAGASVGIDGAVPSVASAASAAHPDGASSTSAPAVPSAAAAPSAAGVHPALFRALTNYTNVLSQSDAMFSRHLSLLREQVARTKAALAVPPPVPSRTATAGADAENTAPGTGMSAQRASAYASSLAATKAFLAQHRKPALTFEEALRRVKEENL